MKSLLSLVIAARLYLLMVPTALYYTGAGMNQAVLIANGGKFPCLVNDRLAAAHGFEKDGMADDVHSRMTSKTKLNWLADYIIVSNGETILSPGDLMLNLGKYLGRFSTVVWGVLILNDYLLGYQLLKKEAL